MIKDQPSKIENIEYRYINNRSQGRSYDNHSDYYRIPLAFGLVYNQGPGFMPGLFSWSKDD